jgi:hypothetical protein
MNFLKLQALPNAQNDGLCSKINPANLIQDPTQPPANPSAFAEGKWYAQDGNRLNKSYT